MRPNQPSRSGKERNTRPSVRAILSGVVSAMLCTVLLALPGWGGERAPRLPSAADSDQAPRNMQSPELANEPADPERRDMAAWRDVGPGVHSGFGSIDAPYPKSLPPEGRITESTRLRGWKGERVACKLLVWSAAGGESIAIGKDTLGDGKHEIRAEQISISAIKYILADGFLNERSTSCGPRDKEQVEAHLVPDLLTHAASFTIDTPGTRPVWVSIDIPGDTPAGVYEGSLSRKSASGTVRHPITVEVLDRRLPDPADWSFHLDLWQNPFAVARYHEVPLWSKEHFDLLRPLLEMLANAGQKCITTTLIDKPWNGGPCHDPFGAMVRWTRKADGTWHYDYTVFDRYVRFAMECGIGKQINCYSMVPVGNNFSWFDEESGRTVVVEAVPGTDQYEKLWRGFLCDFRGHLRNKGWLDITTLAMDERGEEEMRNLLRFLEKTAPEFKVSLAGFYSEETTPSIDDFSSNWRHLGKMSGEVLAARKNAGLKTTYYVACGIPKPNTFTFSPPAEACYLGWFSAARGFDGFLRWAYNSWPEDPMTDSRYVKWPSGDTFLVYPGARSSVRFERLREGIQDYEKIRLLREELAEKPSAEAAAAARKLDDFMDSVDVETLDHLSAAEVIRIGKDLLHETSKSSLCAAPGRNDPGKPNFVLILAERNDVALLHLERTTAMLKALGTWDAAPSSSRFP